MKKVGQRFCSGSQGVCMMHSFTANVPKVPEISRSQMDGHTENELNGPRHATDAGQSPLPPLASLPRRENVEAMSKCQPEMEQFCQQMMLLMVPAATLAFLQKRSR